MVEIKSEKTQGNIISVLLDIWKSNLELEGLKTAQVVLQVGENTV